MTLFIGHALCRCFSETSRLHSGRQVNAVEGFRGSRLPSRGTVGFVVLPSEGHTALSRAATAAWTRVTAIGAGASKCCSSALRGPPRSGERARGCMAEVAVNAQVQRRPFADGACVSGFRCRSARARLLRGAPVPRRAPRPWLPACRKGGGRLCAPRQCQGTTQSLKGRGLNHSSGFRVF